MKVFIKTIFLLYIFPLLAFAYPNLKSDDNLSESGKITLTVATTEDGYFPYYYKENGKLEGLSVDVLNYFEENSKYEFDFVVLPWPRALYLVAHDKVDLLLTLFKTPKREKEYHFIEPSYGNEVNQLFTLVDNEFKFDGKLQQLTPYSIGTLRRYSYGEAFDKADYLHKSPALTEEVLVKLLLSKRIDMMIGNPLIFKSIMSKENVMAKVKSIEPYIAITPVYMVLAKGREDSQEIKKTLGQLSQQLKASPYYKELLDKYQLNFNSK